MDTYLLAYLCIVLIYGTYLCLTTDNMQIPAGESNDDADSNKVVLKQRLRGINTTYNQKQDNQQQDKQQQQQDKPQQRKVYTDDDFICDCNNVYKEQHELEREIIEDMINKHYLRSGKKIQTYYSEDESKEGEDEDTEQIREETNTRVCDCEGIRKNNTPHEWILLIPQSNVMLERENKTRINKIDEISRTHLQYALASMFEAR